MGFLNKLLKKKAEDQPPQSTAKSTSVNTNTDASANANASEQPKRIKRYTSDGKPVS